MIPPTNSQKKEKTVQIKTQKKQKSSKKQEHSRKQNNYKNQIQKETHKNRNRKLF